MTATVKEYKHRGVPSRFSSNWVLQEFSNVEQGIVGTAITGLGTYAVDSREIGVTNPAWPQFWVQRYGATGGSATLDTVAFQRAHNSALAMGGGEVIVPNVGVDYVITTVGIQGGVSWRFLGCPTITRPADQPDFTRTFTVDFDLWADADDSPLSSFIGPAIIDGNAANQGPYSGSQLEHCAGIFTGASDAFTGRFRCVIQDIFCINQVGDGIAVGPNSDVELRSTHGWDCFRGAVTLQGGYSKVRMVDHTAGGDTYDSGLHLEPDVPGYGGSMAIDFEGVNIDLQGGLSIAGVYDGDEPGRYQFTNTYTGPNWTISSGPVTPVRFVNSTLVAGEFDSSVNRIINPGDLTFDACSLSVSASLAGSPNTFAAIHVYMNAGGETTPNRRLRFRNCDWKVADDIDPADTLYALYVEGDLLANDNRIEIDGGTIPERYDTGLHMAQGGVWLARNLSNEAVLPYRLASAALGYNWDVTIDGGDIDAAWAHIENANAANTLTIRNVVIDEDQNVLTTTSGLTGNVYRGGRVILGAIAPTTSDACLRGDTWRLAVPLAASDYEWTATNSSVGAGGALWSLKTTLA